MTWLVKNEQRSVDFLIDKCAFAMLVMATAQDYITDLAFEYEAMSAIQAAAESYMVEVFQRAKMSAIEHGYTVLRSKDLKNSAKLSWNPLRNLGLPTDLDWTKGGRQCRSHARLLDQVIPA